MYATSHANDRASSRLYDAGLDTETIEMLTSTAEAFASKCGPFESVALRLKTLSYFVGNAWSDASNGDTVIAIVRGRMVQTYMLRRRSQPFDKNSLSVERVVTL